MGTDDAELWKKVDQLLKRRPGWKFQATATPSASPVWYFGKRGAPEVSVTVQGACIWVSGGDTDHDATLKSTDELMAWLTQYLPGSLGLQKKSMLSKLRDGSLFKWD